VQLRKGAADESVQLLKALPATATTAAQTWALLSKEANGRISETLMQCDYTKCTAKVRHKIMPGWRASVPAAGGSMYLGVRRQGGHALHGPAMQRDLYGWRHTAPV